MPSDILVSITYMPRVEAYAFTWAGKGGTMQAGAETKRTRRVISEETRKDIERLVNIERRRVTAVARDLGLPHATVGRIAGVARGDEHYLARGASTKKPRIDVPMPLCPFQEEGNVSLRDIRLNEEEKFYLACLVNVQRLSCAAVATRYDIPKSTVESISRKTLRQCKTQGGCGKASETINAEPARIAHDLSELQGQTSPTLDEMKKQFGAEEKAGQRPPSL